MVKSHRCDWIPKGYEVLHAKTGQWIVTEKVDDEDQVRLRVWHCPYCGSLLTP